MAKVREPRASPPAPIPLAPPAQVHTGEMMASRLTKLLTGAPWSRRVLPPPPRDRLRLRTLLPVQRWTLEVRVRCSQSPHETAQSNGTLILSGKGVCVHVSVQLRVKLVVVSQGVLVFFPSRCVVPTDGEADMPLTLSGTLTRHTNMPESHRLDQNRFI